MEATALPEVLFCIFSWLDPADFGKYGLISKSWQRMSQENELWKHLCFKKWKNNPNNSQIWTNPLIPVIEVSNVIDWKRVHNLRTSADVEIENLKFVAPLTGKVPSIGHDYFEYGWITFDGFKALFGRIMAIQEFGPASTYIRLCSFLMEYELVMLQQFDSSLIDEISFVDVFLKVFGGNIEEEYHNATLLIVKNTINLRQVTLKRKIPIGPKIYFPGKIIYEIYQRISEYSIEYTKAPLYKFLETTILLVDDWTRSEEFKLFISENYIYEQNPIQYLCWTLEALAKFMELETFMNQFDRIKGLSLPTRIYMTVAAIVDDCEPIMPNLNNFFEKYYPWLFGDPKTDLEILVPTFDTLATVLDNLTQTLTKLEKDSDNPHIETKDQIVKVTREFLQTFLTPVLSALNINHIRLSISALNCLLAFCGAFDESSFEPILAPLLNKLYPLLGDRNMRLRLKAADTIGFVLTIAPGSFHKHKEHVTTEFNKILANGDSIEQGYIVEIICRLGAKIGDEMTDQVTPIYDNLIASFKHDRSTNENQLLMASQYAVISLKNSFNKYIPIVLPAILENCAIAIFTTDDPNKPGCLSDVAFAKRCAALECTANMVQHMDRELLVPYYEQLGDVISANIDISGSKVLMENACVYLEIYVKKFFTLESTQVPVWTANVFEFIEERLVPYAALMHKLVVLHERTKMLQHYYNIMKHLCTMNPLIHPLHNDNHMTLSVDVVISSLMKWHNSLLQSEEPLQPFGSLILEFFRLILDHSLNEYTFYHNFWIPILGPQIIVISQQAGSIFPLTVLLVNEALLYCGKHFTQADPTSPHILISAMGLQKKTPSFPFLHAIANNIRITASKYPHLIHAQLLPVLIDALEDLLNRPIVQQSAEIYQCIYAAKLALTYREKQLEQNDKKAWDDDITELIDAKMQESISQDKLLV